MTVADDIRTMDSRLTAAFNGDPIGGRYWTSGEAEGYLVERNNEAAAIGMPERTQESYKYKIGVTDFFKSVNLY